MPFVPPNQQRQSTEGTFPQYGHINSFSHHPKRSTGPVRIYQYSNLMTTGCSDSDGDESKRFCNRHDCTNHKSMARKTETGLDITGLDATTQSPQSHASRQHGQSSRELVHKASWATSSTTAWNSQSCQQAEHGTYWGSPIQTNKISIRRIIPMHTAVLDLVTLTERLVIMLYRYIWQPIIPVSARLPSTS